MQHFFKSFSCNLTGWDWDIPKLWWWSHWSADATSYSLQLLLFVGENIINFYWLRPVEVIQSKYKKNFRGQLSVLSSGIYVSNYSSNPLSSMSTSKASRCFSVNTFLIICLYLGSWKEVRWGCIQKLNG